MTAASRAISTPTRRPLCADVSAESGEALEATASRVDHWIAVEYRGLWAPRPLEGSLLAEPVKAHLREQVARLGRARLLFIRRPDRRGRAALVCLFASSAERGSTARRVELVSHDELVDVDFGAFAGEAVEHPLLLVCTHGKRDRCCARYGRPLYDALRDQADEDWLWQCTHVGGDRFAGNVVVLPEGLYYGRVAAADAWTLLDEHLAGRVYPPCYRGRSTYSFPVQAAERAVREQAGSWGIEDVSLVGGERTPEGWRVELAVDDRRKTVDVVEELGPPTYLTCSATELRRPKRYSAAIRSRS